MTSPYTAGATGAPICHGGRDGGGVKVGAGGSAMVNIFPSDYSVGRVKILKACNAAPPVPGARLGAFVGITVLLLPELAFEVMSINA